MEKWKNITGYEGLYQVSDQGRVRSLDRHDSLGRLHRSQIKSQRKRPDGYLSVDLFRGEGIRANGGGGRGRTFTVHKLVATEFCEKPDDMEGRVEVCHLDGDRGNNKASNLAWGSTTDNRYDSVAHGTHYNAKKEFCPRGHELVAPNLTAAAWNAGSRNCKACNRAGATLRSHPDLDFQSVSDTHYANILGDNKILYRKDFVIPLGGILESIP